MTELDTINGIDLANDVDWLNFHKCGCCSHAVATTEGGTTLFIVVGWESGFDNAPAGTPNADGDWRICAKIGYQHSNNMLQCDMDDFYMPYNKNNGEVDDTTTTIEYANQATADVLNQMADRVWSQWKDKLDELD